MCGIYGVMDQRERREVRPEWLPAMGDAIIHRGPDDSGLHADAGCAIGMRRLSIIDVAGGHQPIYNEDESLAVVCNGEIYNYRELRARLEKSGHVMRSGSDVEVIPHLYEQHGDAFVEHLEGMFAFALWDRRRRRLLLGRDRLGIKPLYLYSGDGWLAFASEAKSLQSLPFFAPGIAPDALADYLNLGYVPGAHSLFQGVEHVLPGTMQVFEGGRRQATRYWRIPRQQLSFESPAEAMSELRATLDAAVEKQMVADVPVGAFLSGGLDSSSVVASMSSYGQRRIRTYAIGYEGGGVERLYNELPFASEVARNFNTEHHEILVKPDVAALLPRLVWHLDEPVADSALVTTFLVSEFASRHVKVILSGVGGDELLGGYTRYLGEHYARRLRRIPGWFRRAALAPLVRMIPSDRHSGLLSRVRYARSLLDAMDLQPDERYQHFLQIAGPDTVRALCGRSASGAVALAYAAAPEGDWLHRIMAADLDTQLCDDLLSMTDRMSMAASIECRVPLLDESLVAFATRIPAEWKVRGRNLKWLFKQAMGPLLPPVVTSRPKRGFGAPFGSWMRGELWPLTQALLDQRVVERRGLVAPAAVRRLVGEHLSRREDHSDLLLALLLLEIWCRLYLDRRSVADVDAEVRDIMLAGRHA